MQIAADLEKDDVLHMLQWQIAMGADEAIDLMPSNHMSEPAPVTQSPASPQKASVTPSSASKPDTGKSIAAMHSALNSINNLDGLRDALLQFDACPLKATASNLCFYDGNPQARVMLIGEAPGREEDIEGRPFVGVAGQLLDKMLHAIGLDRQAEEVDNSVFMTNVVFWRPPGNRKPTASETLMCLPFLNRTIELVKPDIIVCLGNVPMHRLTGRVDGILKTRGRLMNYSATPRDIPLLATFHPSNLLAVPTQKRLAWRDFLALRRFINDIPVNKND